MSVRMRHTRAHTANRRSHHAIAAPRLSMCEKCNEYHERHKMCANCGTYRGREVMDVVAKVEKKQAKKQEKEKALSGK